MSEAAGTSPIRLSQELTIFHDVAKALTSSLNLDSILQTIMEKMAEYFRPDTWSLLMVDEEKDELYFAIAVGAAAEVLAKEGIEATVVNARFVKPLDAELLLALARSRRLLVTIEEAYLAGGFGSAVLELLEENGLQDKVHVVRMGIPDRLVTHGDPQLLLAKYGLDADGIYMRVKESIEVLDDRRARRHKV